MIPRRTLLLRALNESYRAALAPAWRRFERAARDPERAQRDLLDAALRRGRRTAFGREHQLDRVRTLSDYQAAVPVRDYDALAPWIERALSGEPDVLAPEPPRVFEKTSGSAAASKYIPYTPGFLREFAAATSPWLFDLLRSSAVRRGSSYWSISPAEARTETTPGGTPIGFQDDTEYFPRPVRRLLRVLLPVPPEVARLPDVPTCRYVTLRYLLADPCLSFISVWSPSFLTLLLEFAIEHADRLARDLICGSLTPPSGRLPHTFSGLSEPDHARGALVRWALRQDPPDLEALWPSLSIVSCWADGAAATQLPALQALLPPNVELQAKGLLATEGVVSFPLLGEPGSILAVASHLLELLPSDDPSAAPLLPHQLELGRRYQPLLTTAGGLYRYRLGDEVEVVGRRWATPLVRFRGRVDGVSDVVGEKLAPGRVVEVLQRARNGAQPPFLLLAPDEGAPPAYVLYVEGVPPDGAAALATSVEAELREGHHYDRCRRLEQLGPVRARVVTRGWARYEEALTTRGVKAGNIKPTALHTGRFWEQVFPGADEQGVTVQTEPS